MKALGGGCTFDALYCRRVSFMLTENTETLAHLIF